MLEYILRKVDRVNFLSSPLPPTSTLVCSLPFRVYFSASVGDDEILK